MPRMPRSSQSSRSRRSAGRPGIGSGPAMVAAVVLSVVGLAEAASAQNRVEQRRNAGGAERVAPGGPRNTPGTPGAPGSVTQPRSGGRYVDQGSQQFLGGANPIVTDPGAEFRRRNALVTGNAAGGRGFRGVVGYSSPFDFRASLGSEDLFEFRAASLFSDPRLLQAAPSLRYGTAIGQLEVYRTGRGSAAGDIAAGQVQSQRLGDLQRMQPGVDGRLSELRRIADASALEAGLDQYISRSGAPTAIGVVQTRGDLTRRLSASTLAGLQPALADADLNQFGVPTAAAGAFGPTRDPYFVSGMLSPMDQARLVEDARAGRMSGAVGELFRDSFLDTRVDPRDRMDRALDERVDQQVPSTRVGEPETDETDRLPSWQRIRDEVARRAASALRGGAAVDGMPSEEERRGFESDLERLRRGLGATPGGVPSPDPGGAVVPGGMPGAGDADAEGDGEGEDAESPLDVTAFGRVLRHGQRVDALVDPADRSRAAELIGAAEGELRRGEYFQAERSFTRALRLVPGHPTATAGLAHARLGAGLYIPAAMVIRDLFTYQPEMIGATYAAGLMPNRPRLLQSLESLRSRAESGRDGADTGLVMAYVGWLLERPEVIREGLDLMEAADESDSLRRLLGAIWLEGAVDTGDGG
ncbi:MAG: hypothetical protein ACYTEV_01220 [Planctomycetota bacterium]